MSTPLNRSLRAGIAAAQAQQFDRARPLLEEATRRTPDDVLAWFWLAAVATSAEHAIECLRRVLALDAGHAQARVALAKLLLSHGATLASTGDRAAGRVMVGEATRLTPESDAAWLAAAALSEDPGERLDALRHAAAIDPARPEIRTRLREALVYRALLLSRSDRAEARVLFREAAALDPSDPRVWQALARLADTPAEAIEPLREFTRVAPDQPAGRAALKRVLAADAQALADADRGVDACGRWREVLALDERDIDAWIALAETTDSDDEAQQALDNIRAIDPDDDRVIEALRRFGVDDASALVPSMDAFARFEASVDPLAESQADADALAAFDSPAEIVPAFAAPPRTAPARTPVPALRDRPAPPAAEARPPATPVDLPAASVPPPAAATVDRLPSAEFDRDPCRAPSLDLDRHAEPALPAPAVHFEQADAAASDSHEPSARRTVMVVDDSPTIRKILGLTLERAGYRVVAEPDGESAVERLSHIVPDLILLDIAMPKLDGYEVCKRIKKDPRTAHVPIVMLSGKDAFFDKVKGHMAGATEYLTKPFETPAVLAVVNTHCQPLAEVVNG